MRFLDACRLKPCDATPVWFMRQAGRYFPEYRRARRSRSIVEICSDPALAAEVSLQPVRFLGVDAAILFSDILLPLRPMGVRLDFAPGEGPVLSPCVRTEKAVERLRVVDPAEGMPFLGEAVRMLRRELDGKVPVIGFAGAPFTLASYLIEGGASRDCARAKAMMRGAPRLWRKLMGKLARVSAASLKAQAEAGAQALQLFDSWAGALSKRDYVEGVLPYSRRVLEAALSSGLPVIHFGTGNAAFLEEFAGAAAGVVGVDWRLPLDEAWSRVGFGRAIQGNLDPAALLSGARSLRAAVRDVLRRAAGRPGHIFNLGHGVLPETPPDALKAVVDWVRGG
jgi:uroporphyrinogen decarboxylase